MRNYNKYKKYVSKRKVINPFIIIAIFLFFIIALSIGYASFSDVLTINGQAKIGSFTIDYILNGGTNVVNPITEYNATSNAYLPIPTYTNYVFDGWYEDSGFTGVRLTTTPTREQCKKFNLVCKVVSRKSNKRIQYNI